MDKTDISFNANGEKFNYRVCAVMINDGRILTMRDEHSPYRYLPGGRVKMGETAEEAVIREIREELFATPEIVRPLWLNQAFFTEETDNIRFHELCVYFLMDISRTELPKSGGFTLNEKAHTNDFMWLEFERLKDEYFYPEFLKEAIFELQENFTLRTEYE